MSKFTRMAVLGMVLLVSLLLVSAALAAAGGAGRAALSMPAWLAPESLAPSIVMTKTVGTDAGACAVVDEITVQPGTDVTYCYEVENTGSVTFTLHSLDDSQLGPLLSSEPITLTPGASTVFTTSTPVTQTIANSATWTATNALSETAAFTDTALVNVLTPTISLTKTVSTTLDTCGAGDAIDAVPGQNVLYCYEMLNTGPVTVTSHTLVDDQLGTLLSDENIVLGPGESTVFSTTAPVSDTVTNIATWTADDGFGTSAEAVDSATVTTLDPSFQLSKTANTTAGVCPGSNAIEIIPGEIVNYCYEITNTGPVTLTLHTLTDDQLGLLIPLNTFIVVPPAATYTFSTTAQITESVVNRGTWTADDGYDHQAVDIDNASVTVLEPAIVLTKTVSDSPGICAPTDAVTVTAGSSVTYCYEIENTSEVTVTSHTLVDDVLGALFTDTLQTVGPGETMVFSTTVEINLDTVNTATWTAQEPFGKTAQGVDTASVTVTSPGVELIKTLSTDIGSCSGTDSETVVPGTLVEYCYELKNTGTTTLTSQTLVDDHLGTLLDDAPINIPPGGSTLVTQTTVITQPVDNIAIWTAVDEFATELQTGDSASVDITGVSLVLEKTVGENPAVCAPTAEITVTAGSTVVYCYKITNTGQVTLTAHTLVDSELGLLLNGASIAVPPAGTYVYTQTQVINDSVTNLATWTATDVYDNSAVDSDSAEVNVVAAGILVTPGQLFSSQPLDEIVEQSLFISNTGTTGLTWSIDENVAPTRGTLEDPDALGDSLFSLNLGAETGSEVLLGVEFDGTYFWVTAGGVDNQLDSDLLYQFDRSGNLISSFPQPPSDDNFGWRDLAFDGSKLYSSGRHNDFPGIDEIDPTTGSFITNTIPITNTPLTLARAIAYDPATDHFWIADFSSMIYEIERDGTVVNSFANAVGSIYGLAWDDVSPGGPFLWAWTSDNPPRAIQVNPLTGQPTGVSFTGDAVPGSAGGGAAITTALNPDRLVLVGMHQALSDTIVGYDLGVSTGICSVGDADWLSVSPTGGNIPMGSGVELTVEFDSNGLVSGFYSANLCVNSSDPDNPLIIVPVELGAGFNNAIYLPLIMREP